MDGFRPSRAGGAARQRDDQAPDPADDVDETLIEMMLELKLSDRLRTVSRYANALARFRPV